MRNVYKILFVFLTFFIGFSCAKADDLIEGIYTIETTNGKVVESLEGETGNTTRIQLNDNKGTENQKWSLKKSGNGYYEIVSLTDKKYVFDVKWGSSANGTQVWLYEDNNSDSQKWYLKETNDGYYNLVAKNGLYLDVVGGVLENGNNVQIYRGNGSVAQKFKLTEELTPSKTIEDGNYIIHTYDNNYVIDLNNYSTVNGNNIHIYSNNIFESKAQIWNVKYLNDGYYEISSSIDNKKVFDVAGGNEKTGSNVQIYDANGTTAQKWIIKEAGDGYYYIITPNNHKYLDISGGNARNGANIQIYFGNGSVAQKFKFEKYEFNDLEDGMYTISSALDNNKVIGLDRELAVNGSLAGLWTSSNANNQKWNIKKIDCNIYSITSVSDLSKSLDVAGGNRNNGATVQTYSSNSTISQRWIIRKTSDGYYRIISQLSNKSLDVHNSDTKDGTKIQMYDNIDTKAQKFKFIKTEKNYYTKSYDDGYYQIVSTLDNNKVLDVNGGNVLNGNNVQLYSNNSSLSQIWYFKYLNDGYYQITTSINRNVSLDVAGASMNKNANAQVYKNNNSDAQTWLVKDYGDGTVGIVSKQSGLYIDVASGNTADGTNIQLYNGNDSKSQKFKLVKYTGKKIYTGVDVSKYQKEIDWGQVATSGVNFAIIRAGSGGNYYDQDDPYMMRNIEYCEKYNIPYALYLYSYARNDSLSWSKDNPVVAGGAVDEANHMLRLLNDLKQKGYKPNLSTQIFIDMEDGNVVDSGKDNLTKAADTFCNIMNQNGYTCGVYSNTNWLNNNLDSKYLASKYPIWYSWYFKGENPSFGDGISMIPQAEAKYPGFKYWQFASDGKVNGIVGNVDVNIGFDIFE